MSKYSPFSSEPQRLEREDVLPGYALPSWEGHNLSHYCKKRKRQEKKELDPHFLELQPRCLQTVVSSGGRGHSLVSLSPEKWQQCLSNQVKRNNHRWSKRCDCTRHQPWGWSGGQRQAQQGAEAGAGSLQALATPLPFPGQDRVCCIPNKRWAQLCVGSYELRGVLWKTQSWWQSWSKAHGWIISLTKIRCWQMVQRVGAFGNTHSQTLFLQSSA